MSSKEGFGNNNNNKVLQLAKLLADNTCINLNSIIDTKSKHGRTLVEKQVLELIDNIGINHQFSLREVLELLIFILNKSPKEERLLIAPSEMLDLVPDGKQIRSIPSYLEAIIKEAKYEILLLTPFWDIETLIDLLLCIKNKQTKLELILLLVSFDKRMQSIQNIIEKILFVWQGRRIRIFFYNINKENKNYYPHAKCLIIDRERGYLGSANFTGQGMKTHFEVGTSLNSEDSKILGDLLQNLWSKNTFFSLIYDSSGKDF